MDGKPQHLQVEIWWKAYGEKFGKESNPIETSYCLEIVDIEPENGVLTNEWIEKLQALPPTATGVKEAVGLLRENAQQRSRDKFKCL